MVRAPYSFFVCPECGKITISENEKAWCCNSLLNSLKTERTKNGLSFAESDGDILITSPFPQTKEDYVTFIAVVNDEKLQLFRFHPEWDVSIRLPLGSIRRTKLYFHRNTENRVFCEEVGTSLLTNADSPVNEAKKAE